MELVRVLGDGVVGEVRVAVLQVAEVELLGREAHVALVEEPDLGREQLVDQDPLPEFT